MRGLMSEEDGNTVLLHTHIWTYYLFDIFDHWTSLDLKLLSKWNHLKPKTGDNRFNVPVKFDIHD